MNKMDYDKYRAWKNHITRYTKDHAGIVFVEDRAKRGEATHIDFNGRRDPELYCIDEIIRKWASNGASISEYENMIGLDMEHLLKKLNELRLDFIKRNPKEAEENYFLDIDLNKIDSKYDDIVSVIKYAFAGGRALYVNESKKELVKLAKSWGIEGRKKEDFLKYAPFKKENIEMFNLNDEKKSKEANRKNAMTAIEKTFSKGYDEGLLKRESLINSEYYKIGQDRYNNHQPLDVVKKEFKLKSEEIKEAVVLGYTDAYHEFVKKWGSKLAEAEQTIHFIEKRNKFCELSPEDYFLNQGYEEYLKKNRKK